MERVPSSLLSGQMRDFVVKKKSMRRHWEFPVRIAETAAFAQQHVNLCLLVGTTEVKDPSTMAQIMKCRA